MKIRDWEKYIDTSTSKEKFRKKPKIKRDEMDKPKHKKRYKRK